MARTLLRRFWPRSLQGQVLLTVALALLLAQAIGAVLLMRSQEARREAALIHTAALRIYAAEQRGPRAARDRERDDWVLPELRGASGEARQQSPLRPGEQRIDEYEGELRRMLTGQGFNLAEVVVLRRAVVRDEVAVRRAERRARLDGSGRRPPRDLLVAAVRPQGRDDWIVARVMIPRIEARPLIGLIFQTVLTYAVLVGAIALILGRITRPLAALAGRMDSFARDRDPDGQLDPQGPDDVQRLIVAHNGMERRIASLLDEKDVMLGAIGHDLKTPLSALRVRIESVEDEAERAKMAATIEDITRSLDDILSLARVGRPSDPREPTELSALISQVADEFEDLGEPVTFAPGERIVASLRPTWLRRALRNLVSNALRYGKAARIDLARDEGWVLITIADDGPGIPEADIARMQEPFTRGDSSRNSATGGAGLGLALARAIAEQHGGQLALANHRDAAGAVTGLIVTLRLPLT
ncbi:MAG: ATP-binding protein [Novosphingobium sp.]|uniref:sensor histidine kinase n=1 Tax=Novosphingobium sp. TaxID=1874826 RepID=UPI0032B8069D